MFISTCRKVYHHNRNKDSIGYTYEMGLNSFSDLTKEEYINMLTTYPTREHYKTQVERSKLLNLTLSCTGNITTSPNPPDQVDWSKKAVTAVVKQGACGSSYAIAAIGAIEALYSLKYGKLDTMSYQQVLDCSGAYGNEGCQGGFMDQAFWYIQDNGLASSKTYPNKNINQNCTYTKSMKTTSITRCADVPTGSYIKLQSSVIQGPTTVAIDASEMKDYKSGIYNKPCSSTYINQAMLVVGYGVEDNQTYWKIKNSFGAEWGEDGYLRLERTVTEGEGKCGIQQVAVTPQILI